MGSAMNKWVSLADRFTVPKVWGSFRCDGFSSASSSFHCPLSFLPALPSSLSRFYLTPSPPSLLLPSIAPSLSLSLSFLPFPPPYFASTSLLPLHLPFIVPFHSPFSLKGMEGILTSNFLPIVYKLLVNYVNL